MRLVTLVIAIGLSFSAYAQRQFQPVTVDGQEIRYEAGTAYVLAETSKAQVAISYSPDSKKTGLVIVRVTNIGDRPFNVTDSSVTVQSNGAALEVPTYQQRVAKLKRAEMWSGIATGLAAAANSINASSAGYETYSGTYRANTNASFYGSGRSAYGTATTTGYYSGSGYNATAAQLAKSDADYKNQILMDQQRVTAEYARKNLQDRALRTNTIDPGMSVIGDVEIELPKRRKNELVELSINVEAAGEVITFRFRE